MRGGRGERGGQSRDVSSSSRLSKTGLFVKTFDLRKLVYLVIYDSGQVSLEHLLLSRYPPESISCYHALEFLL